MSSAMIMIRGRIHVRPYRGVFLNPTNSGFYLLPAVDLGAAVLN